MTPVTIFGGYLGSGKTTILMNALKQYEKPVRFALIKNEFGDASVDARLMSLQALAVKEVVNGCLCCILTGSLNPAVDELIATVHPERILIEASGNALPFPIVLELKKNPQVYIDGVITVVDCLNFAGIKDTSVVAQHQARYTDLVIFNKTKLAGEERVEATKEAVFGLNPDVGWIESEDGVISPRVLFGIHHVDTREVFDDSVTHDAIDMFVYRTQKVFDRERLTQVLHACERSRIYRIKGMVRVHDQAGLMLVNGVFGRITMMPAGIAEGESALVFIGKGVKELEPLISDYLDKA